MIPLTHFNKSNEPLVPNACELDWEITYNNDDGDFCRNVRVQVNGLTGDCADCDIRGYTLLLNGNGVIQNQGTTLIDTFGLLGGKPDYMYSYNQSFTNGVEYSSSAQFTSLISLGSGEVVDFDFLTGFDQGVSLCAMMQLDCNGTAMGVNFCKTVDLLCW